MSVNGRWCWRRLRHPRRSLTTCVRANPCCRCAEMQIGETAGKRAVRQFQETAHAPHSAMEAHLWARVRLRWARIAAADAAQKTQLRITEYLTAAAAAALATSTAAAGASRAAQKQLYAAVKCVGRWGDLQRVLAEAEREAPLAAAALDRAREAAGEALSRVEAAQQQQVLLAAERRSSATAAQQ